MGLSQKRRQLMQLFVAPPWHMLERAVCENAAEARKVKTTLGFNEDFQQRDGGGLWE